MRRKIFYAAILAAGALMGLYYLVIAKAEDGVLLAVGVCWVTAVFGFMYEMNRYFSYYEDYYGEEYEALVQESLPVKERLRRQLEFRPEEPDEELEQRQSDIKLYIRFILTSGFLTGAALWLLRAISLA